MHEFYGIPGDGVALLGLPNIESLDLIIVTLEVLPNTQGETHTQQIKCTSLNSSTHDTSTSNSNLFQVTSYQV